MTAAAGSREGIGDNAARFGAPRTRVALVIANLANRSGGAERIFVELANMLVGLLA